MSGAPCGDYVSCAQCVDSAVTSPRVCDFCHNADGAGYCKDKFAPNSSTTKVACPTTYATSITIASECPT